MYTCINPILQKGCTFDKYRQCFFFFKGIHFCLLFTLQFCFYHLVDCSVRVACYGNHQCQNPSCSVWWNNHQVVHSYAWGGSKYCVLHHREHIKDGELTRRGIVGIKPKNQVVLVLRNSPAIGIPRHPGAFH